MIRSSDGGKAYWGYYQDYLEEISGKKKFHRFSAKIIRRNGEKNGRNASGNRPSKKMYASSINVDANMASSYGLTCL